MNLFTLIDLPSKSKVQGTNSGHHQKKTCPRNHLKYIYIKKITQTAVSFFFWSRFKDKWFSFWSRFKDRNQLYFLKFS